jgi:hypothetical protein
VTLPIYLALHVAYGALMSIASSRRMMHEQTVLGLPFVFTLAPVALVSVPVAAVLMRFTGEWFLHGALYASFPIETERFHLGLTLVVGAMVVLATVVGHFAAIMAVSREMTRLGFLPVVVAGAIVALTLWIAPRSFVELAPGQALYAHPAALVSVSVPCCLIAAFLFLRARLATPVMQAGAPA